MEPTLTEVTNAVKTFVDSLVVIKNNGLLKETTLDKIDAAANIVLDKVLVCLPELDLCGGGDSEEPTPAPDPQPPYDPAVYTGFSLNIYTVVPGVTTYTVSVDGTDYTVVADETDTGVSLHAKMKTLLESNTQGFSLEHFNENGSETNYGFGLKAAASAFLGKKVVVSVSGEGSYWGNITINGVGSPADPNDPSKYAGLAPGISEFYLP